MLLQTDIKRISFPPENKATKHNKQMTGAG